MSQSCPQCHSEVDSGLKFCPVDGTDLAISAILTDPLEGTVLGDRYLLGPRIGEGGMGMVYFGTDQQTGARVAVKRLHAEMLNLEQAVKRFRREGEASRKLDHPNIVKLEDSGQTPDGALFLVLEYVEGIPLSHVIHTHGAMKAARVVRIARQMLEALGAAHAAGVIHRDLKPDNIMICDGPEGQLDQVKILDFGIAKVLNEEVPDNLTRTGMVFGTPEYMSPEQGVGQKVDHRADLYAAGVVLYQMLCGRKPFEGDDKIAIIAQHISVKPPRPSEKAPEARIPAALEGAVMLALEKRPADRFQTAADFLAALDVAERALGPAAHDDAAKSPTGDEDVGRARTLGQDVGHALRRFVVTLRTATQPPGQSVGTVAEAPLTTLDSVRRDEAPRAYAWGRSLQALVSGARTWVTSGPPAALVKRIPPERRPWAFGAAGAAVALLLVAVVAASGGGGTSASPSRASDEGSPSGVRVNGPGGEARSSTKSGAPATAAAASRTPSILKLPDLGGALDAASPLEELEVSGPAETAAREALLAGNADAALAALGTSPLASAAGHYMRGRALAMKGDWVGAKPELLSAFGSMPNLRRDPEMVDNAIKVALGPGKHAGAAREVLEAIGTDGLEVMEVSMRAADREIVELRVRSDELKAAKKKLTPAEQKRLADLRKRRKMLRKVLEKIAPGVVDLRAIWVSELKDTRDCDGRAALIKSIREAHVAEALPVLEAIQKEGTGLFSGNFCLRGSLPATIKELRGE